MTKVVRFEGVPTVLCPGCGNRHHFNPPEKPCSNGARWTWNSDRERPTFSPSMNETINPKGHPHYQPDFPTSVCHSFVQDGRIQFLGDCTHALAGQTVDLPDWPEVQVLMEQARGEGV